MDIDLLSKMVKELILDNDEVALPGVGTFVAELVPSSFSDKGYTINPPYRKLSFTQRTSNDTLLRDFYIRTNNIEEGSAQKILSDFFEEMREVLKQKKVIVFPGLGRLRATKENNFFFVADEDLDIYPAGYGLEPVSLKTHQETIQEVDKAISGLKDILSDQQSDTQIPSVPLQESVQISEEEPVPSDPVGSVESVCPEQSVVPVAAPVSSVVEEQAADEPVSENSDKIDASDKVEVKENVEEEDVSKEDAASETSEVIADVVSEDVSSDERQAGQTDVSQESTASLQSESRDEPETSEEKCEDVQAVEAPQAPQAVETTPAEEKAEAVHLPLQNPVKEEKPEKALEVHVHAEEVPSDEPAGTLPVVKLVIRVVFGVLIVAAIALLVFILLAHIAPDFIDSILYTEEELKIINY